MAPTNTQAIVLTTLGLLLIVGGGFYIRRQRKATAAG
ncbi:MAG: LPXTG cell wall anchor domain-containing protein [Chloroflexi bacterium]|nr:LPXTG cell wall anchor domain-containing protein [Chloroflexota bacterium]